MRSRPYVLHMLVAMLVIFASASVSLAAPPSDSEILSKVDAIAADYMQRPGAVGLSIGVARKGEIIVAKAYGLADAEFDVPADKDTMFRIGSVTKQFTAAAIMRFVEQGKLSLDDELSKFLPDFPLQDNTVTIRQLLNHTSGIPSYTSLGEEWAKLQPLELTHDEMLALVKDKPFDFKPGEQWSYNNTAYYMLGIIIEKVSGVTYAQHMQDAFFTPMGLERTRYDVSRTLIKNRAQGYTLHDGELVNDAPLGMSQPYAAGSLLSTGEELVEWSMALTTGKVVTPESFTLMTTVTILPPPNGESTHYGFGLQLDEWESRTCIRHGGGIHGFNSMLMWLPDEDVHIAVISNGEPVKSGRIANAIAQEVLGIEKVAAKDEPITPEVMQRIVGNYKLEEMDVRIWEEEGKAMLQASAEGQLAFAIQWQGEDVSDGNEFRASFDQEVKMIFADDGKSFTLYQGGGQIMVKRVAE
jgi:D-alanyl-D-alanine carboxypeptidase